jgi:xanthine dehydrogenase molybdopterin-binding subunit B
VYVDDLVVPGAGYGATIRSTEAHARFLGLELEPAFDWSSVVVVTAADIPGENVIASIQSDQPVLVSDEIRHHAEPVALIAAPDRGILRAAKRAVRLRTEPLPAVFDPVESDHEFAHYEVGIGDVDTAMAGADLVLEGTYRVGHQEQLYIENQGMIAVPRPDGGVTVHGSLQCPYYVHPALKRALALSDTQAVVIQTETGGGFGGKEEYPSIVAVHAALLALKAQRPVRMIYDRHEDIAATTKRHPAIVRYRTGVMRDGTLVAQDIDVVMDGGAYCTLTPAVPTAVPTSGSAAGRPRRTRRPMAPSGGSVLPRPSSRPRCKPTGSPTRWACPPWRCAGAGSISLGTRRPPGRCFERASRARRSWTVLPRPRSSSAPGSARR